MPAPGLLFHEILSASPGLAWIHATGLWIARLLLGGGLAVLGFLLVPKRRREILLALSLGFLGLFFGWRVLLGQVMFAWLWHRALHWADRGGLTRKHGVAAAILMLSCGLYFGMMSAYRLGPAYAFATMQSLGLSYLFWRVIHITVDWKQGRLPLPARQHFFLYLFYFPTLIGGPIERYPNFAAAPFFQDESWRPTCDLSMLLRMLGGFAKFFACYFCLNLDYSSLWDRVATLPYGTLLEILYVRALSFYLISSGFTDLTLTTSRILRLPLSENYNYPYFQRNLAHFWRSWHITLTTCLRDYIYEPLGGRYRHQALNYLLTMLVCACWHVISPAFMLWGLMHGVGLIVLRYWQDFWRERVPAMGAKGRCLQGLRRIMQSYPRFAYALSCLLTFHFVALSWLPFWGGHPQGATAILRLLGLGAWVKYLG